MLKQLLENYHSEHILFLQEGHCKQKGKNTHRLKRLIEGNILYLPWKKGLLPQLSYRLQTQIPSSR